MPVVPVATACPSPKSEGAEIEEPTPPLCDDDGEVVWEPPPVLPPTLLVPVIAELNTKDRFEEGIRRPFWGYSKFEIE